MTLKTDPNTTLLPSLFEEVTEFRLEGMTQVLAGYFIPFRSQVSDSAVFTSFYWRFWLK